MHGINQIISLLRQQNNNTYTPPPPKVNKMYNLVVISLPLFVGVLCTNNIAFPGNNNTQTPSADIVTTSELIDPCDYNHWGSWEGGCPPSTKCTRQIQKRIRHYIWNGKSNKEQSYEHCLEDTTEKRHCPDDECPHLTLAVGLLWPINSTDYPRYFRKVIANIGYCSEKCKGLSQRVWPYGMVNAALICNYADTCVNMPTRGTTAEVTIIEPHDTSKASDNDCKCYLTSRGPASKASTGTFGRQFTIVDYMNQ